MFKNIKDYNSDSHFSTIDLLYHAFIKAAFNFFE